MWDNQIAPPVPHCDNKNECVMSRKEATERENYIGDLFHDCLIYYLDFKEDLLDQILYQIYIRKELIILQLCLLWINDIGQKLLPKTEANFFEAYILRWLIYEI